MGCISASLHPLSGVPPTHTPHPDASPLHLPLLMKQGAGAVYGTRLTLLTAGLQELMWHMNQEKVLKLLDP